LFVKIIVFEKKLFYLDICFFGIFYVKGVKTIIYYFVQYIFLYYSNSETLDIFMKTI